ncbi:MAG: hypothetical protein WCL21_03680 [Mariniphaga sp.]
MNFPAAIKWTVSKRILLLEAALVWTFAGGMLLFRGSSMLEASSGFSLLNAVTCLCCGLMFFVVVFSKISRKHIYRITNLIGDEHRFYEFFNSKSYLMMIGMITMGIFFRKTLIVPLPSLSLAYITMGIPLLLSSFRFYHSWYFFLTTIDSSII